MFSTEKYGADVIGKLSGFDRLRLRGTWRALYSPGVMERYLAKCHVRLLDFRDYVRRLSQRVCATAKQLASGWGRPYHYERSSQTDKEAWARRTAAAQGVREGLIGVLSCLEPCHRRSVADMPRRAQIGLAINARYLSALASTHGTTPLAENAATVCRPVRRKGRRYRALNPWALEDAALLQAVSCGDFVVAGLRNRDLRARLFANGPKASEVERRCQAGRITRRLALLRAHGLLHKVSGTHRYLVTSKGRILITALLAASQASVDQLNKMAA